MNLFNTKIAYASLDSFLGHVNTLIINPLIIFLFALAVVYFLYGMVEFIANAENEEKRTKGKSHMLWGVVGFAIMMGVWFILWVVLDTLNVQGVDPEKGTVNLPHYDAPTYPPQNP